MLAGCCVVLLLLAFNYFFPSQIPYLWWINYSTRLVYLTVLCLLLTMINSLVTLGLFTAATQALPVRQGGDLYYEGARWNNANGISASVPSVDTYDYYFEQRIDHFDRENPSTFQQRWCILAVISCSVS